MSPLGEPARPPLIAGPVALMRLVEIDDVGEAIDHMARLGLGPGDVLSETKFNGWLVQSAGGRLWSRRGNIDLTGKFPEIARAASRYDREHLAGELVYWTPEGTMSEPMVTTVAGTKDDGEAAAKLRALPGRFEYIVFDALALRGYEVARLPLMERKRALLDVVKAAPPLRISMEHPFEAWEEVYDQGVAAGGDGVVLKNRHAPYVWRPLGQSEPRPLGNQYKLKPVMTDDFVVCDTARGPKGRLLMVFGQFHQGKLIPVGEVNNLARETEKEVLRRIAEGLFVVELEFQGRFPDPPGALQHARFLRFRDDKKPEDAVLPGQFAPGPGAAMGFNGGSFMAEKQEPTVDAILRTVAGNAEYEMRRLGTAVRNRHYIALQALTEIAYHPVTLLRTIALKFNLSAEWEEYIDNMSVEYEYLRALSAELRAQKGLE